MKTIHINCSFTPGFDDSFDIITPFDIPVFDHMDLSNLYELYEWLKYWEVTTPYAAACYYVLTGKNSLTGKIEASYKKYQFLESTYMTGFDGEIHRGFATIKILKMVSGEIENMLKEFPDAKIVVIPRDGVYPQSNTCLAPNKIHDIPLILSRMSEDDYDEHNNESNQISSLI